mmetsp:Transcript_7097/g.20029  ORF Transcript_7097/g.20029 Transcript_7097/m.20029 type:complete len:150 (+) Transcript_7097:70-519(+)
MESALKREDHPHSSSQAARDAAEGPRNGDKVPEEGLPVFNPVYNYEKINRIGEGTYGVVCEQATACLPNSKQLTATPLTPTRPIQGHQSTNRNNQQTPTPTAFTTPPLPPAMPYGACLCMGGGVGTSGRTCSLSPAFFLPLQGPASEHG